MEHSLPAHGCCFPSNSIVPSLHVGDDVAFTERPGVREGREGRFGSIFGGVGGGELMGALPLFTRGGIRSAPPRKNLDNTVRMYDPLQFLDPEKKCPRNWVF